MNANAADAMLIPPAAIAFSQGSLFERLRALDDADMSDDGDPAPSDTSDAGKAPEVTPDASEDEDGTPAAAPKTRVLPAHLWPEGLDTMPLPELRNIQHLTAHFVQLNWEAKAAARRLEEAYHADIIRCAIKHQVLGSQMLSYLGDGRRLRPPNRYNNFFRLSPAARKIHKQTDQAIGVRSRAIGREWKKLDAATKQLWSDREFIAKAAKDAAQDAAAVFNNPPVEQNNRRVGKKTASRAKSSYDYRSWMAQIEVQMKAMRFSERIEGYMVVVPTDSTRAPHVISTPLGTQYLRLQSNLLKRTALEDFAQLVTGKVVEARLLGVDIDQVGRPEPPKKPARGQVAAQFAHLAGASLKELRRSVRDRLKELLSEATGRGYVGGWPGVNTDTALKERDLKIVIDHNAQSFDGSLLRKPGRSLNKDEALHVLNALDHHWVTLEKTKAARQLSTKKRNCKQTSHPKKKPPVQQSAKKKSTNKRAATIRDGSSLEEDSDTGPEDENRPSEAETDPESASGARSDADSNAGSDSAASDE